MGSELIEKFHELSEAFPKVLKCFEGCCYERFWKVLDGSEAFYDVQEYFDALWGILARSEKYRKVLEVSEEFFDVLRCS